MNINYLANNIIRPLRKIPLSNQVIWLSGGTKGIGLELLKQLIKKNNKVYVSARNTQPLQPLINEYPNQVIGLTGDLSYPSVIKQHLSRIAMQEVCLDCLIINAGTAIYIEMDDFKAEDFEQQFKINFFSAVNMVEVSLPLLRASKHPKIIGVSSSATFAPFTRTQAYGSSKAAFSYFMNSLRVDLTPENFYVACVSPGFVKTPLTDKNDFSMPMTISAESAAKRTITGIERGYQQIVYPKRLCWPLKFIGALPSQILNSMMVKLRKEQP